MSKLKSKKNNKISLIVLIIVLFFISIVLINYNKVTFDSQIDEYNEEIELEENNTTEPNWKIIIPEINVNAEISESTSKEVMNKYVGHFEETKTEYGNVGLAAHNRGYPVNYFQDLNKLKIGSEIIYIHEDFEMTYVVEKIEIIENTNWEYLKNSEDNRITLITCVENEPKYRRCIQGIEKIESEEF